MLKEPSTTKLLSLQSDNQFINGFPLLDCKLLENRDFIQSISVPLGLALN